MCFCMVSQLLEICSTVLRPGHLFFCQQFLSLGLELAEDNSEYDLTGMADGTIIVTLFQVVLL